MSTDHTDHEAPHYAVFSSPILRCPYQDQVSSSSSSSSNSLVSSSRSTIFLHNLRVKKFVKKFQALCKTLRFITVSTTARHWSLSSAR